MEQSRAMRRPFLGSRSGGLFPFSAPLLALSCGAHEPSRPPVAALDTRVPPIEAPRAGEADHAAAPAPADAATEAPAPPRDGRRRIGAVGPHTWIYKVPAFKKPALGKMRIGTSIVLKSPDPVAGEGCPRGWYAVEPRGYVCLDKTATLDLDDPYFKALAFSRPEGGTWPYRYAHSNGAPMYGRVPTAEEAEVAERGYGSKVFKPLGDWAIGHEELISGEPIAATDEVPYFLEGGRRSAPGGNYNPAVLVWKKMPAGSMLAYSRAFAMNGRVWLLTPDTMVVPADRVSAMRRSTFRGVHLDESDVQLPLAWNRSKQPVPKLKLLGDGTFVPTGEALGPKTPVEISDHSVEKEGIAYLELRREPGVFIARVLDPAKQLDVPVVVTRRATKLPAGVAPGSKWIEIKIVAGTLTAYEGDRPVLASLFSPGKGGVPLPGNRHDIYATTATGYFPIEWKERVATMSNEKGEPKVLWFTDVPHQQYLDAPLAMHVAYWHEDFGKKKSAECVNVSPLDGEFLFGWTEPKLPEGWNAVRPGDGFGKSTPVVSTAY